MNITLWGASPSLQTSGGSNGKQRPLAHGNAGYIARLHQTSGWSHDGIYLPASSCAHGGGRS